MITAEHDDDAASIIGRIDTAEEIDLVLMVPRSARGLRNSAVWPHIAAHVRRNGIALSVVAARRLVRMAVADNGLRVAGSLRALRRQRSRRLRLGAREFELSGFRVLGLVSWLTVPVVVAAGVGAVGYSVPTAEIVIVPPSEPFEQTASARVDAVADEADLDAGLLPGVTVRQTFSMVLVTETTGSVDVGDEHAVVDLRVDNQGETPVLIAAETFVTTENGVGFVVDGEAAVGAGEVVTITATAQRAGEIGNVEGGETWTLSGASDSVIVTNRRAATGGTDRAVQAVAIQDVERLRAQASGVLLRVGARKLEESVEGAKVLTETAIITILGEEPFQNLGEAVDTFLMEFSAVVSGLTIPRADAEAFGAALLREALPEGRALLPSTTTVEFSDDRSYVAGEVTLTLTATGLVFDLFEPSLIHDGLTGARPESAASALQERLGLEETPRVTLLPNWLPWIWLPQRGGQISITFEGPAVDEDEEAE
ncbi:MAG TPA: baseplate J/gp47 family protein [Dehalococcoidia bacterium]|nr:baseplate J/gp47 family protein [Dehalococcoidia bacterium]